MALRGARPDVARGDGIHLTRVPKDLVAALLGEHLVDGTRVPRAVPLRLDLVADTEGGVHDVRRHAATRTGQPRPAPRPRRGRAVGSGVIVLLLEAARVDSVAADERRRAVAEILQTHGARVDARRRFLDARLRGLLDARALRSGRSNVARDFGGEGLDVCS